MSDPDGLTALRRLGLSTYEAKVFVALQRLGPATASDIDATTDVPRSQVYGAADDLEARGLVEVQQETPKRYRSVSLDEAEQRLRDRLDVETNRAFSYLETVQGEGAGDEAHQENIWMLRGSATITDRIESLIREADLQVVLAVGERLHTPALENALAAAVARGCVVTVISEDESVIEWAETIADVSVHRPPHEVDTESTIAGRFLMVDGRTIMIGILNESFGNPQETGILSSDSGFAQIFIGLFESHLRG
ncbi:TrmB family transcriptional regulator [Haladaptatus sp. GCM10025707]|uniref:TrmB family transcriptional regulator n=1 Tax=unclassified Haladaptatus TaxID=2622732 RepID=UPI0023E7BDC4|nr:helix-turn-helix domain-containing protein [Haladaptatus sp. QDMS2]